MITIDQIKSDITTGKSKRIYYSTATLWWTHLDSDVEAATEIGRKVQDEKHSKFMQNPSVPPEEKKRYESLFKMTRSGEVKTPLDPTGAPLYQTDECMEWVVSAEKKPEHFGKNGILAFIKSHHQNCGGNYFSKWDGYNELIDNKK